MADLTIATYDQIAAAYLAHWSDRSAIQRYMNHFAGLLRPGQLILDLGCGPGFDGAQLRAGGLRVIGLDKSWPMMVTGRAKFPGDFVQADMTQLPFALGRVDALWVNASLLHIPRQQVPQTLVGFWHILRPGGFLFLSLKAGHGQEWLTNPYTGQGERFFNYWLAEQLDPVLIEAGFIIQERWSESPAGATAWLMRLVQKA